jgi:hypothetical protein
MLRFDFVIVGGGIFGCYAALYLAQKGGHVALIEKEDKLFQKASLVNQARLHSGYHYPRSLATAAMSDEHKLRFAAEHRNFVNGSFEKFYAIDKFGSFTDPQQFERFCAFLDIKCQRITKHPLFNFDRLDALYQTEEHSFDPVLLGEFYSERINSAPDVQLYTGTQVVAAEVSGAEWRITINNKGRKIEASSPVVINATYASINGVNEVFGVDQLALTHEISEIAFLESKVFSQKGLTVMDGPFGSIMPFGLSGMLSLSSVAYTHHKISYLNHPVFDCQTTEDPSCSPSATGICTTCPRRPHSNAGKMLAQMKQYFSESVDFRYLHSFFTIKSKLKASHIDDGRPTEISLLRNNPKFYCLFAGKINSIYEVEKVL